MDPEQFELAIAKLLAETRYPERSKRNRCWRRAKRIAKNDRFLHMVQANDHYRYTTKWLDGPDYRKLNEDCLFCHSDEFKQLKTIHKKKIYIKHCKSDLRQYFKRLAAKVVRKCDDYIPDGKTYRRYFDMDWELI